MRATQLVRIAALAAAMAAQARAGVDTPPSVFAERHPRYRLQLSDELEISFRFTPEFNQKVAVQPDGFISLLDVGDLPAAGLTVEEVHDALIQRYRGILNDPVITVKLLKFDKPSVIVGGKVVHPGRIEIQGEMTTTDAIAVAGGFANGALTSEVLLFRRYSQDKVEVKRVNLKTALKGQPEEDVRLRPGDSIFVPQSAVGKIERFMDITKLGFYFPLPIP